MRKVVVNTTPLIALTHVGQLDILKKLYREIIIPEAVYRELSVKAESQQASLALDNDIYLAGICVRTSAMGLLFAGINWPQEKCAAE